MIIILFDLIGVAARVLTRSSRLEINKFQMWEVVTRDNSQSVVTHVLKYESSKNIRLV